MVWSLHTFDAQLTHSSAEQDQKKQHPKAGLSQKSHGSWPAVTPLVQHQLVWI